MLPLTCDSVISAMVWIGIHHTCIHAYMQKQTKFLYYPRDLAWVNGKGWDYNSPNTLSQSLGFAVSCNTFGRIDFNPEHTSAL